MEAAPGASPADQEHPTRLDGRLDRTGAITAEVRARVRRAAIEVFAERGYQGGSLRHVADRAGVPRGNLYYHYATKQELLLELVLDLHQPFEELAVQAEHHDEPEEALRELLTGHARIVFARGPAARVAYESIRFLTDGSRQEVTASRDRYEDIVCELIDSCRRSLPVADVPTRVLSKVVLAIVSWPYQWYREEGPIAPDRLAEQLAGQALAAMLDRAEPHVLRSSSP